MMSPMDEETASQYITVVDLDEWVEGANSLSIEATMKKASEALRWKREHPNQDLPETLKEAKSGPTRSNDAPNGPVCELSDTSVSHEIEATFIGPTSSAVIDNAVIRDIVFPSHGRCCKLRRKTALLSMLAALFAILSVIAISVSLHGSRSNSSSSSSSSSSATGKQQSAEDPEQQEDSDPSISELTDPTIMPHVINSSEPTGSFLETCSTPCAETSDCQDSNNLQGLNSDCGELSCVTGICQFNAWSNTGNCSNSNFLQCSGDNNMCTRGPSEVSYEGSCTGFANNECIYRWCPGRATAHDSSSLTLSLPTECGTPCTQLSDCEDAGNLRGLNPACGEISCISGFCRFNAWKNGGDCASTSFLFCSGDDALCTKGPSQLSFEGTCSGFDNNECIYEWCPGM